MNYVFDGTFEGLLTAIYDSYYNHHVPNRILSENSLQESIFDRNLYITTDWEKASRVYNSIIKKISPMALQNTFLAYLSDAEDSPIWILDYLKLGWKMGPDVDLFLTDDRVMRVQRICQKVTREKHLFLGLVRFQELKGNIYYSSIEPDHNILPLICPHFANRLADQNWIIQDLRRGIYAVYNKSEWIISDIDADFSREPNSNEHVYQNLWKQYFKNISIETRTNPKLQRKNMPYRYWNQLIEKMP